MGSPFFGSLATMCGVFLIAVCIYFDHIRHKDPHFRKKLRRRREENRKIEENIKSKSAREYSDSQNKQTLILHEIQVAENMMSLNHVEDAVNHFAKAISLCSDPDNIINSLERSLPPLAYDMLLSVLINCYGSRFSELKSELKNRYNTTPTINFLQLKL